MTLELEFSPQEPRPFQPEIVYANPEDSPPAVARATAVILDRYFAGLSTPSWETRYLANQSLGLVDSARKGFLGNMQAIRDLGKVEAPILDALLQNNKPYSEEGPSDEETESFARMYLAFGMLPYVAAHEMLPGGFSKRGVLEPPFTAEELFGRIREVGVNIKWIVGGRISQNQDLINRPGVLRTYWAFQAMGSMPDREPTADTLHGFKQETIELLAEKYNKAGDR